VDQSAEDRDGHTTAWSSRPTPITVPWSLTASARLSASPPPRHLARHRHATTAALVPPSAHQLTAYTLYRFEICLRDTVVGATGLGLLLAESLASVHFPAVTTLLAASVVLGVAGGLPGR
jgi:hypothetical protein